MVTDAPQRIREALAKPLAGKDVLVLVPDHTRSLPLPMLFRAVVEALRDAKTVDVMVALGTHLPLDDRQMEQLVGISAVEREALAAGKGFGTSGRHAPVRLKNHAWDDPAALATIGVLDEREVRAIAGKDWHPSLPREVPVRLNKAALACDHIVIVGPTFPHEVVGFSGGAKYLFPGISGPDMINATHWLGALAGVVGTIGLKDTPVRAMIHAAASRLTTPITLVALVVEGHDLADMCIGGYVEAWSRAADASARRHIRWVDKPFRRVLSCAPPMYDELWTAGKAMYKLEPAVARGGEVVIYAPHMSVVSEVHGTHIFEAGYHILPFFLADWDRWKHLPLGVLAHSTHVRGSGVMEGGVERPNVRVTLASRVSAADCARLNLGYLDPASVRPEEWQGREAEGILYVPKAGEILYRAR